MCMLWLIRVPLPLVTVSVSIADTGEAAVLPGWVDTLGDFIPLPYLTPSEDTVKWIKASSNVFYAWHYYGNPSTPQEAVKNVQGVSADWDVPSFLTEHGGCSAWCVFQDPTPDPGSAPSSRIRPLIREPPPHPGSTPHDQESTSCWQVCCSQRVDQPLLLALLLLLRYRPRLWQQEGTNRDVWWVLAGLGGSIALPMLQRHVGVSVSCETLS